MKKSKGKAQKVIRSVIKELNFSPFKELKSDNITQLFQVCYLDKKAVVRVDIKNKNLVFYDDSNIKKAFKNQSLLGESILDALICNFIGCNSLQDI